MQFTGTLRTWHDDRGFGFIAPRHGGAEVFVHISAFPRDVSRPTVGETLGYDLGRGKDGRPQATRVVRTAVGTSSPRPARDVRAYRPSRRRSRSIGSVLVLALVIAGGVYGFERFKASRPQPLAQPAAPVVQPERVSRYRCDGRTMCSQLTSCEEATWFLKNCPGVNMDGDGDGVPCERQWCNR